MHFFNFKPFNYYIKILTYHSPQQAVATHILPSPDSRIIHADKISKERITQQCIN